MRTMIITALSMLLIGFSIQAHAEDSGKSMHGMKHHMSAGDDGRISLGLSPKMKQHQLVNMRSHVEAVQAIIGFLAEEEYEKASAMAYGKLGATPEMQKMCNSFANDDYKSMGLAFHQSGDDLAATLKTGDLKQSLRALHATMNYCVSCHATYRQ